VDVGAPVHALYYKLSAIDFAGNESDFASVTLRTSDAGPGVLPTTLAFDQDSPNPVRRQATFHFDLPQAALVSMRVFDVRGRLVRTVFDGRAFVAGRHQGAWDLRDGSGDTLGPGVYLTRFDAGVFTRTVKVVVVK